MKDLSIWKQVQKSEVKQKYGLKAAYVWYKFRMAIRSQKPKEFKGLSPEGSHWWAKFMEICGSNDERSVATDVK